MTSDSPPRSARRFAAWLAAPVAVFLILLFTLEQVNGSEGSADPGGAPAAGRSGLETAARGDAADQAAGLQRVVAADPRNVEALALLGDALYAQFRETADPSLVARAQKAFDAALALDPRNVAATIGQGTLALVRHDFRAGLEYGVRARRLAPALVRPFNLIADAQIELGRYDDAAKTLQRFVTLKPSLPSYARVSYFRELNGDVEGSVEAMRLAVSAAAGGEPLAYVKTLLAGLEFNRGRLGAAERLYGQAAASVSGGYVPALAGLARVAAARESFPDAIKRYRGVVERLPIPEYVIALAETELAAGRDAAAKRSLELVEAEADLFRSEGLDVDTELTVFEADHGDPREAVALGARLWRRAPSVRSADAYAWALHRASRTRAALSMSRRAMRLGSRDPAFLYHAGQIALAAGERARARTLLKRLVAQSPRFNPLFGPRAWRTLAKLP